TRWPNILDRFLSDNPEVDVFGLYGEGALPSAALLPDFTDSYFAASDIAGSGGGAVPPTAVVSRSRMWWDRRDGDERSALGEWMSDKFVAQVWCNRAMLVATGRDFMNPGEPGLAAKDDRTTFLDVIQRLVSRPTAVGVVLVDGTKVIPSRYLYPSTKAAVEAAHRDRSGITGTTKSGYPSDDEGKGGRTGASAVATITRALWPPEYILDTVRKEQGIIIVSSVNCGYVDMASNFLQSVNDAAGDVKVLFVARDELAFDFLDAVSPGCTVLFPEAGSERANSVQAGRFGDNIFKQQTIVRPDILLPILHQGYKALYTDVDIVWLGNALSLLPNSRETQTPPVMMLQAKTGRSQTCTCFMYLDSTPNVLRLLELWKQEIAETSVSHDQAGFQSPLAQMQEAGLALSLLPEE
ncbi:unnamed protein product, partial [Ectocarpus fasciculatus]